MRLLHLGSECSEAAKAAPPSIITNELLWTHIHMSFDWQVGFVPHAQTIHWIYFLSTKKKKSKDARLWCKTGISLKSGVLYMYCCNSQVMSQWNRGWCLSSFSSAHLYMVSMSSRRDPQKSKGKNVTAVAFHGLIHEVVLVGVKHQNPKHAVKMSKHFCFFAFCFAI